MTGSSSYSMMLGLGISFAAAIKTFDSPMRLSESVNGIFQQERVLFICTHNSARSQMAEGLLRALYGNKYEAYSAGTEPTGINPYAVRVMGEIGIDISAHHSKSVDEFRGLKFGYVVTVCDHAKETCPFFPGGKKYLHQGFKDPSEFKGKEEKILDGFRRVRDEIRAWIVETFGE